MSSAASMGTCHCRPRSLTGSPSPTPSRLRRWAAIDLIHDVPSATDLVPAIVAEAVAALDRAITRR
jgi:hypothetical protein